MRHQFEFDLQELVYLKTDIDQSVRIVTGIYIIPGSVMYVLNCGSQESTHYGFEISRSKDVVMCT